MSINDTTGASPVATSAEADFPYIKNMAGMRAQTAAFLEVARQLRDAAAIKRIEVEEARTANLIALYTATQDDALLQQIKDRLQI